MPVRPQGVQVPLGRVEVDSVLQGAEDAKSEQNDWTIVNALLESI